MFLQYGIASSYDDGQYYWQIDFVKKKKLNRQHFQEKNVISIDIFNERCEVTHPKIFVNKALTDDLQEMLYRSLSAYVYEA